MTSWEDKAHLGLAVALLGLSVAVLNQPVPSGVPGNTELTPVRGAVSAEATRAVRYLEGWIREAADPSSGAQMARLRVAALGKRGLSGDTTNSPAVVDQLAADGRRIEALVLLLESNALPRGDAIAALTRDALGIGAAESGSTGSVDPGRLDLLALATLAEINVDRRALGDALQLALRNLEREYRALSSLRGKGVPSPQTLQSLAREWADARGLYSRGGASLRFSAAVFRASAVLGEPTLMEQARHHLASLLFRQRMDRHLYGHLLQTQVRETRPDILRDAVANAGQLIETLYQAHLAFRRGPSAPTPSLARAMHRATRDLLHYLEEAGLSPSRPAVPPAPDLEVARAAVHALRGLRLSLTSERLAAAQLN